MMSLLSATIVGFLCCAQCTLVFSQVDGYVSTTPFPPRPDDGLVTVPPAYGPLIDNIEQFVGMTFPPSRGRYESMFKTRGSCYKNCFQNRGCQGFTWNTDRGRCVFYLQGDDVCSGMVVDSGSTFYKLRARCFDFSSCGEVRYDIKLGYMHGGQAVPFNTINDCADHCMAKPLCYALSYNIQAKVCYFYSTTGLPFMEDNCCLTYVKKCHSTTGRNTQPPLNPMTGTPTTMAAPAPEPSSPTAPPAPEPPSPTMAPPAPAPQVTTPPDLTGLLGNQLQSVGQSGCPQKFQEVKYMSQHGGMEVLTAPTVAACQKYCLSRGALCVAVDFNTDVVPGSGPACFWHNAIIPMSVSEEGSVIRYVRTKCVEKQCATHAAVMVPLPINGPSTSTLLTYQTLLASPMGVLQPSSTVSTPACAGNCVTMMTSVTIAGQDTELVLRRECNLAAEPFFRCHQQDSAGGGTGLRTATCSCYGDKCNVLMPATIMNMEAYYPFDATGKSYAGERRHAYAFGIIYDVTDKKKNISAMFNGKDAYFEVPSFAYQSIGRQRIATGAALTVTFWFKQTVAGQDKQTLLSNGDLNYSSLSIFTSPVDAQNVLLNVELTMKKKRFKAMGMVSLDEWTFVALTLTPVEADKRHVLGLYINNVMTPTQMINIAVPPAAVDPVAGATGLDIKPLPLVIGAALNIATDQSVLGFKYFFSGKMDELFISYRAESTATLMALKFMTNQPHNFNP